MHFDHDFGIISSFVKIDTTSQPLQGGTINVLEVVGSGGVKLPAGDSTTRIGSTGLIRFNSAINSVEYFDGTTWDTLRDNGSVTATVTQPSHGFTMMQLLEFDVINHKYKAINDLSAAAGVVTQVIDADTFVLTLYGLITNWPTTFDGYTHFWYRDVTTNAITTSSSDTDITANHVPLLYAATTSSLPIIIPISKNDVTSPSVGCFIPSSSMFFRPYLVIGFESPAPSSPRLLSILHADADITWTMGLARYVTILSSSVYAMPSLYMSISVDLLAISYNSPADVIMTVVTSMLPQPTGTVGTASGTPGYVSTTSGVDWTGPTTGIKQVVGFVNADQFYYCAPYVEQATPGSVYVSHTAPAVTPGIPYMWVQTGLNTDGKGMTFWIEDGTI